jgi:mannuronan synthase
METVLLLKSPVAPVTLPSGNDHPVVDLPFTAVIDGRQFRGRGLSLVAAYVSGLIDPQAINAVRIVRLVFQFDGFSVALVAEARVREGTEGSGTAELAFVHPTGAHLPQLRHILNAFIAGDLMGLGQTLGVAATRAPQRPPARGPPPKAGCRSAASRAGWGSAC